ncbi:MAG: DUF1080 domain-containing protein [Tannerella sp.]|jgi:hypothetical protein|nr:DUF1080 domain-containing protein [Tannerella sp.]
MRRIILLIITVLSFTVASYSQTVDLFNGKDLSNWNFVVADDKAAAKDVYSVQDGVILIKGTPLGYMYTKEKYSNFVLELEWSWVGGPSNSGIFLLIEEASNPFPKGIECQLHAGSAGDLLCLSGADLEEYVQEAGQERPAFPSVKKREPSNEKPVGEWNKAKVEIRDGKITVHINGTLQNVGTNKTKTGHIGLQSEGGPIKFRNVKITK